MHKARSGSGSIRQRKTGKLAGKWRLQYGYEDPITKEWVSIDKTFQTEREAQEFLDNLKAQLRTGQMILEANVKKALTLVAWFDELSGTRASGFKGRWLDDGTQPNTIGYRVGRFDKYVRKSDLATLPMKFITTDHSRALFRQLKRDGVGEATISAVRSDLVKVMNDAIETYEKLPYMRNPFKKVKLEASRPRAAVALTVKQAKKAIARQTTVRDRAMLGMLLLGGVRLGELMALTKEQIDFKKGVIMIDRAICLDEKGRQTVGDPKGSKLGKPRTRLVVMCPSLAALLCPLMDSPNRYVFGATTEDIPRMKNLVYRNWKRIKNHSKYLPMNMKIKDCRLSHNNWIEKLMPTVSLSTRLEHLGHSTTRKDSDHKGLAVNLTNYTRFLSEAHDVLRGQLEEVLGLANSCMVSLIDHES